ncbi:unnamed protein product [Staurois parvus]|uniref:Uncharacterized protein n=1 Tax=Staurois parvus TaxID=386267 RepID=A0ABN9F5A3_9NEOB|nr:unnamed protein product [Staurois parvus]
MFKFVAVPAPVRPDARRDQNTEAGCRHRPEEMAGTLQGTHCGSKGQGKRCRESLSYTAW